MKTIREYIYPGNQAKICVYLQDHDTDNFVLCFQRPDSLDYPGCDIEIAMRPDEALVVASMLSQAVAMSCSAYDVDIDTDILQSYGNFTPSGEKK